MKYYFIKCEYRLEDAEPIILLWGRNLETHEKVLYIVRGFLPYFYVLEKEGSPNSSTIIREERGFRSIFEEECKKIIVSSPSDVKELKKYFSKTFEADVPFTRRFLIDTGIRRYFTVDTDKREIHYSELVGE